MVLNFYWVTFEKLMMKIYDFFFRLSRLVTPYNTVQKSLRRWKIFYSILYGVTKQLSRIKKIINFHHQFFKPYPTPSAINVKNHFHISDLDSYCRYEVFFDDIHKNIAIFVFQGFYSFFLRDLFSGGVGFYLKEWVRRIYSFIREF